MYALITKAFWSNLFRRSLRGLRRGQAPVPMLARVRDAHKLDPESERQLAWVSTLPPLKKSDGSEILELSVWTEGSKKCAEHCWHPLHTKPSHREALKLKPGAEHGDYACCLCTHGLCHVGTRAAWLAEHPLTKNHRRVPLFPRKNGTG